MIKSFKFTAYAAIATLMASCLILSGCSGKPAEDSLKAEAVQAAQNFLATSPAFAAGNILEAFELVEIRRVDDQGNQVWEVVYQFDGSNGKYDWGDGPDTPVSHEAVITIEGRQVKSAVVDGKWDISTVPAPDEIDIHRAPIHEVDVYFMESYPIQLGVRIQMSLRSGCTTFHDAIVTREGNEIRIAVTAQEPRGMACPAVYIYYDKNLNLGTDFVSGETYTLIVNDFTTTFVMQ